MNIFARLETRDCPVCGAAPDQATLFLEASYDPDRLTGASFASRKVPEFMSYRLLRCGCCATVYASAAPPAEALAASYSVADYDSSEAAELAADTYAAALAPVIAYLPRRGRALEIGTGTGALLERLLAAGFNDVVGIEPSGAAIAAAAPSVRGLIREGVFDEADFADGSFDLICCFQTLEHVSDPRALVHSCARLLRPGGALALVTHDYAGVLNRLLGRRSPIIDIEHLQLFCRASLERLLHDGGVPAREIRSLVNRYPMHYWLRLTPLPGGVKRTLVRLLNLVRLDRFPFGINVGNLLAIGCKPRNSRGAPAYAIPGL
jgi:SAM-dependent methyltransferase